MIDSGVPTTLEKDLDLRAGSLYTDMDLIILTIVFLFHVHGSPSCQLAAARELEYYRGIMFLKTNRVKQTPFVKVQIFKSG